MSGGSAWKENHKGILDHARDLHYDHVPGITLPATDASRETWTTAMDAFNDWKARERAKEAAGQAWWQTYKGGDGGTPPSGGTPPGGGTGPPDWDKPDPPTGTGPYPDSNIYFPMLVPEYNDPKAQDWSQYMSQGGSGLLFQPWSKEYGEQYMQPNIWDYQPPELKVGRPKYYQNPLGIMDVTDYVPPSESTTNPNDPDHDQTDGTGGDSYGADSHGGMMPGDRGYLGYMAQLAALEAMMDLDMNTDIGGTSPGGHSSAMGGPGSGSGSSGGGHHGGAEGGAGGGHSNK